MCALASQSFEGLLRALGWRFSDDPQESHPFAHEFDVLGVRLNMANLNGGSFCCRYQTIQDREDTAASEGHISDCNSG